MSEFHDPGGSAEGQNAIQDHLTSSSNGKDHRNGAERIVIQDQNDSNIPIESTTNQITNAPSTTSINSNEQPPSTELKAKKKKRRIEDLGFSSPGPAFLASASISSDGGGTESESDTNRTTRSRRQSRLSNHVLNGNAINKNGQRIHPSQSTSPAPIDHQTGHSTVEAPKQDIVLKPSIFRNFTPKSSTRPNGTLTDKVNGKGKDVDRFAGESSGTANGTAKLFTKSNGHHDTQPGSSRKDRLLDERRKQMDKVYKDHDMLVRELFHLNKFVTLFGFDPEVSKRRTEREREKFVMIEMGAEKKR